MTCGRGVSDEDFMLTDEVWKITNPRVVGRLCIGCVEKKLGRSLHNYDFTDSPLNDFLSGSVKSARLIHRLTH